MRERCIFSSHSFIKDPPFSRLDLISCRNVMIYLGAGSAGEDDSAISLRTAARRLSVSRSFRKCHRAQGAVQADRQEAPDFPAQGKPAASRRSSFRSPISTAPAARGPEADRSTDERNLARQLERIILQRYRPACVTVKENGDARLFLGTGQPLISNSRPASPDTNVAEYGARRRCAVPCAAPCTGRGELARASRRGFHFRLAGLRRRPSHRRAASRVPRRRPLHDHVRGGGSPGTACRADSKPVAARRGRDHPEPRKRTARLRSTRQTTLEELETTNEELQSANEEYQSTNEELETSKEELQSFNEELETVNAELNRKVAELDHANSDLQNLLNSTQIATIFLDLRTAASRISRPRPGRIPADCGRYRPADHRSRGAVSPKESLIDDIKEVLRTLETRERQADRARSASTYQMRILPYRTVNNVIDGVVITFLDVTKIKEAEQRALAAQVYAENIVETVREPLLVLDADLRVKSANKAFYEMFQAFEDIDHWTDTSMNSATSNGTFRSCGALLTEVLPQRKARQGFPGGA